MLFAATAFTVGNTMIAAGVLLAVVLILRALRRGQTRPEATLGGGISGFDRRAPRIPDPPPLRQPERTRRRWRDAEPTTVIPPDRATTASWSARDAEPAEPASPWHEPPGGDRWPDDGPADRPEGAR